MGSEFGPESGQRSGTGSKRHISLRQHGRDVLLAPGQYVIGRSLSCDVVIDEPGVSRRHAKLHVDDERIRLVDLGSLNGLYVNGLKVSGAQVLRHGDVITVGEEELTVNITVPQLSQSPRSGGADDQTQTSALRRNVSKRPAEPEPPPEDESRPTMIFNDLGLLGRVADRALVAGHIREAENMLQAHLTRVLDELRDGPKPSTEVLERAVECGLKLARAAHRGSWFDYVIDILTERRWPLEPSELTELQDLIRRVDRVDARRLRRYAHILRSVSPTMESIRAARLVDELERLAEDR